MAFIVLVDDDASALRMIEAMLTPYGHVVRHASSGREALAIIEGEDMDLVLLNPSVRNIDCGEMIRQIRMRSAMAIVILASAEPLREKVDLLRLGADDVVTAPFAATDLEARVRAAVRRVPVPRPSSLVFGTVTIDLEARLIQVEGRNVHLTKAEFALLVLLVREPGKVQTSRWLLENLWRTGSATEGGSYLRVLIGQLRHKLGDDPGTPRFIATARGVGYRWVPPLDSA